MNDVEGIRQMILSYYTEAQCGIDVEDNTAVVKLYIDKLKETEKNILEKLACDFTVDFKQVNQVLPNEIWSGITHIKQWAEEN